MKRNGENTHPTGASDVFKRLPEKKRETVFNAAVDELALHGYRGASLNRLVKNAGISKGSIFQYFESKLGLFRAVGDFAVRGVREYLRGIRETSRDKPLPERLKSLLSAGFTFIDRNPSLSGVFFNVLIRGEGPEGREQMSTLQAEGVRFLGGILDEAKERGELDESFDTGVAAHTLFVVMVDLLSEYFHSPADQKSDRRTLLTIDMLMSGLTPRG